MIQVVAFFDVHYDQPDAYGNYAFLGQILEADEIWAIAAEKKVEKLNKTC